MEQYENYNEDCGLTYDQWYYIKNREHTLKKRKEDYQKRKSKERRRYDRENSSYLSDDYGGYF